MLSIKVESTVGCSILEAITEMHEFSAKLDVITHQKLNSIDTIVFPHTIPSELHDRYKRASELNHKVVG